MGHRFPNLADKVVLITGGTRGIGLETALCFGSFGAQCILTYRWGDHDEEAINGQFSAIGARKPMIVQANAADSNDTKGLFDALTRTFSTIDILISNVSSAVIVNGFNDYSLKGLKQSLAFSTWPMIEYTRQIHSVFGGYPRYVIGVSSTGPDYYSVGYDFVAASKMVMEVFVRHMNVALCSGYCDVIRGRTITVDKGAGFFDNFRIG